MGLHRAFRDTHPTTHATGFIDHRHITFHVQRVELAEGQAGLAADAFFRIDPADVSGGGQHRGAVAMGLHRPAAAGAAIADGVEAPQHGILEKSVMHVPPLMLRFEDCRRLFLGDAPGPFGMMLDHKSGKGFADNQTNVQRLAGFGAGGPAGAIQHRDVIGILQHDVAGPLVGNHLLQVFQANLPVEGYQLFGALQAHHLAVIALGKSPAVWRRSTALRCFRPRLQQLLQQPPQRLEGAGQAVLAGADTDIEIRPAGIEVAVDPVAQRHPAAPAFPPEGPGRGFEQVRFHREPPYHIDCRGSC